jgi:hypothetical protein
MKVGLELEDAPGLRLYSVGKLRELPHGFVARQSCRNAFRSSRVCIMGWKAAVYNEMFVGLFNALPRALVRPLGWHLMGICDK